MQVKRTTGTTGTSAYRNLDVSTVKELARRWRPDVLEGVKKHGSHLALDDIRDSINELRHYRDHFFKL